MTEEPPAHADRLAREGLDARVRRAGRAPERPLHDAGRAVPVDRPRVGGPRGRADLGDPLRRPPRPSSRWCTEALRLGARRVPRLDHGLRDDGGAGRRGRRAALRPVGDAAVLRLPHGRLLRPLAEDRPARRARSCRRSSGSTGSARTTTGGSCGPASARTAACWSGSSERCDGDGEAVETPIGRCRRPARSTPTGSTSRGHGRAAARRPRGVGGRAAADPRPLRPVRRPAARRRCAPSSPDWRTRSADVGGSGGPSVLDRSGGPAAAQG